MIRVNINLIRKNNEVHRIYTRKNKIRSDLISKF